jgi:hypothetical protein
MELIAMLRKRCKRAEAWHPEISIPVVVIRAPLYMARSYIFHPKTIHFIYLVLNFHSASTSITFTTPISAAMSTPHRALHRS